MKNFEIFLVESVGDLDIAGQGDLLPILIKDKRLDQVYAFLDQDPLAIVPFLDAKLALEGLLADSFLIKSSIVNFGHICEFQVDSERLDDVDRGRGHVGRELLIGHRDHRQSCSQVRLEEALAIDCTAASSGGGEAPGVGCGADATRYVLVEDAIILLLLDVAELVVEAGSGKDADGRERRWPFEEFVGGYDDERIDDCEGHVGLIDVFVASCQDPHGHIGPADLHRFDQEVVAFISCSLVDMGVAVSLGVEQVLERKLSDIIMASLHLPVEPKPVQAAEDVAFSVVGADLEMERVTTAYLPEPARYLNPGDPRHLNLRSKHSSRSCK